ncbi:hypothetical protein MTO96_005260 [Rhipicephalus appendiculatus]
MYACSVCASARKRREKSPLIVSRVYDRKREIALVEREMKEDEVRGREPRMGLNHSASSTPAHGLQPRLEPRKAGSPIDCRRDTAACKEESSKEIASTTALARPKLRVGVGRRRGSSSGRRVRSKRPNAGSGSTKHAFCLAVGEHAVSPWRCVAGGIAAPGGLEKPGISAVQHSPQRVLADCCSGLRAGRASKDRLHPDSLRRSDEEIPRRNNALKRDCKDLRRPGIEAYEGALTGKGVLQRSIRLAT